MRHSRLAAKALQATFAAALLSGCQASNNGSPPTPVTDGLSIQRPHVPLSVVNPSRASAMRRAGALLPGWMRPAPAAAKGYAWVSQFNFTNVNEYTANNKRNGAPLCQILGQPYVNGLGIDAAGHVWVPQGGDFTGTTTEFQPNCGSALLSIKDTDGQPAAIAFDSKAGVYIENIMGANGPPGNVDVYKPGATKPSKVLKDSQAFLWFDIALDASDNVFVIYSDVYNKGHVIEFARGKNTPTNLPMSLGFPGGVTFDSSGNLLVVDQDAVNVSVYKPPFTGAPIATFPLKADSVPCRFAHAGTLLYCADFTLASVDVYNYHPSNPGSTAYAYSFSNGIHPKSANAGIALSPAPPN